MKTSLIKDAAKLILIFGILGAIIYFIPWRLPSFKSFELSVDNEKQLGDALVKYMITENPSVEIMNDAGVDSAVAVISSRLISNIETEYDYSIRVIKSEEVNAFTMPGGNIFIHSGLIEFSDNPEQVAAVLAHELGHAEERHVVNRLVKEFGVAILFSILTGDNGTLLSELMRTAASTVFDRSQEKEADEFALKLLERSSIDPVSMASFFKKLNKEYGSGYEELEILMTHPNHSSRIESAEEYQTDKSFHQQELNLNWNRVKTLLSKSRSDR